MPQSDRIRKNVAFYNREGIDSIDKLRTKYKLKRDSRATCTARTIVATASWAR